MFALDKLATALNRRDEVPNQELAQEIVRTKDKRAVKEIVENLRNKDKRIQSDCIKVVYEIGMREPALIAPYYREFARLLDSKNNRLVWGAMTALDSITAAEPKKVHSLLAKLLEAADRGSVITRDHVMGILVKLGAMKQYAGECVPLLIEQLMISPDNQFPMYAEMSLAVSNKENSASLQKIMVRRLDGLEKESQKKRVAKVLKTLAKQGVP